MALIEIVAADRNWGIGKDGDMCHHLPEDMAFFRRTTLGGVLLMGRKTLDSFPGGKPLPKRINIVITHQKDFEREGCLVVHSVEEALSLAQTFAPKPVFVVGGGTIYRQMLPFCTKAYITKIDTTFEAPDTFIDNLDALASWRVIEESAPMEQNGLSFRFVTYERGSQ